MIKIKIYTTDECPYCVNLEKFLLEKEIPFEKINIFSNSVSNPEEIIKIFGSEEPEVPLLEINGKIIKGFQREKIIELIELEKQEQKQKQKQKQK